MRPHRVLDVLTAMARELDIPLPDLLDLELWQLAALRTLQRRREGKAA
jgi:hypothetical protein